MNRNQKFRFAPARGNPQWEASGRALQVWQEMPRAGASEFDALALFQRFQRHGFPVELRA